MKIIEETYGLGLMARWELTAMAYTALTANPLPILQRKKVFQTIMFSLSLKINQGTFGLAPETSGYVVTMENRLQVLRNNWASDNKRIDANF